MALLCSARGLLHREQSGLTRNRARHLRVPVHTVPMRVSRSFISMKGQLAQFLPSPQTESTTKTREARRAPHWPAFEVLLQRLRWTAMPRVQENSVGNQRVGDAYFVRRATLQLSRLSTKNALNSKRMQVFATTAISAEAAGRSAPPRTHNH